MRIISGFLGGRKLRTLPDLNTRPAMARTRESLFSMLEARGLNYAGCRVLDLFAGTGSLAFEALSRGAAAATLVESGKAQCACLCANIAEFALDFQCQLVRQDVIRFLRKPQALPFGLVFIDPPYRHAYLSPCLAALGQNAWLSPGAFVVAEVEKEAKAEVPTALLQVAQRLFGQTLLKIWKYGENSALSRDI